jgi:hypothetical protein
MSLHRILAPVLLAFVLMLASCGKEAPVAPCGGGADASTKGLSIPEPTPPPPSHQGSLRGGEGKDDIIDGGDAIGDDGDDLSDTERNRKKR